MKTKCDCGQYPIYPGSDECRVCDGSYGLTEEERGEAINRLPKPQIRDFIATPAADLNTFDKVDLWLYKKLGEIE